MKFLGQHFLQNKAVIQKIVGAIDAQEGEIIIEIGPGRGELTLPLLQSCIERRAKLVAIERDEKLAANLTLRIENLGWRGHISVISADALEFIPGSQFSKIVGNIPYYLTGYLLRTIGELDKKPERCVFMVQREVAERICAAPPQMNRLAASVQFWAEPKIIARVDKNDFSPPPKVDSAVIVLYARYPQPDNAERYYAAVRAVFAQPRKTILNNLTAGHAPKEKMTILLSSLGIDPKSRPQNLTIKNIREIADTWG